MKRLSLFFGEVLLTAIVLCGLCAAQHMLLRGQAPALEEFMAQLVQRPATYLLKTARRDHDELMQQRLVQAQLQADGVIGVSVLDAQKRVLFDAEPARIGRPFERLRNGDVRASEVNPEDEQPDLLALTLSFRPLDRMMRRHTVWSIGLCLLAWGIFSWRWWSLERRRSKQTRQLMEIKAALEESRQDLQRCQQETTAASAHGCLWAHILLQETAGGYLLDHRQRLVAASSSILQQTPDVIGKSWQDIPALQETSGALIESLENPGKTVLALGSGARPTLEFLTFTEVSSGPAAVRIRLVSGRN